jgi:hypothetical protein
LISDETYVEYYIAMPTTTTEQPRHLDMGRMFWVAPLTTAASVMAVLAVREVAVRMLHPKPSFAPLTIGPPIFDTILGCLGAIFVFASMVFYEDSVRRYRRVAVVVLVVSFLPDVGLAVSHEMGGGWPEACFLMVMHVVVWAICVTFLPGLALTRSDQQDGKPKDFLSIR